MDKHQHILELELEQLKSRLESDPQQVISAAEQCLAQAKQLNFSDGILQSHILISRGAWCKMDYRFGLKTIKQALQYQHSLESDEYLPEILHIHALHFWGQAKYYTAQQYWINALEQASLTDEIEIIIESLIGLGNIWRITNEYSLACCTHELAVSVANKTRIHWLEGKARILWAWDLYLLEQYLEMLSVLDGAEEALRDHTDNTWQAEVWDFRGLALLGLERLEDAEQATKRAHELAKKHNLVWMKAHSYISRARLELLRKNHHKATELLLCAEQSAQTFDNGELLSQICLQQSRVAEQQGDHQKALIAFKKYRRFSLSMLREQTFRLGLDRAHISKRQLEQRAHKLIRRVRNHYEYNPEKQLSHVVAENDWWEQLMMFKAELQHCQHSVMLIHHDEPHYLDICTELIHTICTQHDLLSRLSPTQLGLLLAETGQSAEQLKATVANMIQIYPWQRKGLSDSLPVITLQTILSFPFTLEQLEHVQQQDNHHGSATE
ncbi:hypothetical protein CAG54_13425 [Vibrio sp. V27_P1S3P104]|uniref:hypothetical protein n=1 Tax=unclassified Vibrio TaxID=2614977 RepID=UPI001372D486|nr:MULTISPECIES: hypothetical protein [unclassified Vibrio]NAW69889.1 hypothetical protein [Vibrio sp. V28_P6S34P95]NAX03933.1 hypothetical protein [Vibrio sp. V30_P3S12P165]NAX33937.1 hypothetical protein [Vibrio sp. V29_P1S30P107]NAX38501.1 hypothetical protein [Vibrio sp. V27_P1S3P104]NAX39614.1 hypothetical protein [Vibrio sp. V26_P1S5P106]